MTPGGVRGDGTHKDAGIRRTPSSPAEQSFAPCSVPRHSAPLCPATCQAGDRRPGYGTYEDIRGVRHRDPVQEGQQKGLRGGLRASVQGAELGHLPLQGCRWMRVRAGAPVEQRLNPDHREIEETKEREQQCEKLRASSSITATSPPLSSRTALPARCAVQSIASANPRTPRPGWGTAPPGSPLCIPRGVPMLCLPAARCRPPLLDAPGAAARCCPRLPAGCGRRGAPAVWEGPIGRSQQIRTGRRHAGSAPSPAVLGGGLFLQLCFCTPPTPGPRVLRGAGAPKQPLSTVGYGWGVLFGIPPPQTPATLLHLCAGWKGWWIPIAMGTWHFACQPAAFPGNVGLFCWERRVAWRWEEELGLGSAGEEIPLPQMHRSQSPHQCCLHQFTREPNACLCLGGGSRTSGDTGTVMPQATSLLV